MSHVNKENPNCANCNKSGLAILPVRYAVVPTIANADLPAPLGNKVTNIALKHHKYALRTLRKGYLYLYYEKHARGRDIKWEVYSVSEGGTLWKQNSIGAIREVAEVMCSNKGHLLPASVITIDRPDRCGRVWMAFSEHSWSEATFKLYEDDVKLRDRRMQTFNPALWIKQRGYRHGLEATEANLNQVVEYKTGFVLSALGGTGVKTISQPDGQFDQSVLRHCSTVHQMTVCRDDKSRLIDLMKRAGESPQGKPHAPVIIALWDSVGITHELNGFRNDAAGWIKKYGIERDREIGAAVSIQGAKKALEKRARDHVQSIADADVFHWDAARTQAHMQAYDTRHPINDARRARQVELCARWEQDAAQRAPAHLANWRSLVTGLSESEWQRNMSKIDGEVAEATRSDRATGRSLVEQRDAHGKALLNDAVANAWPKYEALIDRAELDRFMSAYSDFVKAATKLMDARTEDAVAWLKATALQDALTEFHDAELEDGLAFEETIGALIMGITSSPAGKAFIADAVDEAKCTEKNLLWRAIAFNQRASFEDLELVLHEMAANQHEDLNENTLGSASNCTKYFAKVAQLVSKALSLHNAQRKKGVNPVWTGGQEKILLTVGEIFMRPFVKKGTDKLAAWLMHGFIMVRTGSDYRKVMDLLQAEAKFAKLDRAETLLLMSVGKKMAKANAGVARKEIMTRWSALAKDADVPKVDDNPKLAGAFNEAKEIRFAIVATMFQLMYFTTLYDQAVKSPDNEKISGEIWAAGMSLAAGISDVCAIGAKIVTDTKEAALTYQGLKLAGGFLSAGAAWMNYQKDKYIARENLAAENYTLATLYYIKSLGDVLAGVSSAVNSISYTKPAFETLARKIPSSSFGRTVLMISRGAEGIAGRAFVKRALLIFSGMEFGIALIAIDLLIWKFSDNELQKWCRNCAFGKVKKERSGNAEHQKSAFDSALKEVME